MYDIIIVGGGLAGLSSSILLGKAGWKVLLIEKKEFPFHKVCGEYLSNESLPLLQMLGINLSALNASDIDNLLISTQKGSVLKADLELGGIGISRYKLDNELYKIAISHGVEVMQKTQVANITFHNTQFEIKTKCNQALNSSFVIGSYGKRDSLDKQLDRSFMKARTGFMAVKYHVKGNFPTDQIQLHNFKEGYCGFVKLEDDLFSLCYLTKRSNLQNLKDVKEMERKVLYRNPFLENIFATAEFVNEKPLVINEINFQKKELVHDHVFMCGDSAGLITPLCGNGMSMALKASFLLCDILIKNTNRLKSVPFSKRKEIEGAYKRTWNKEFSKRLFAGRTIQPLFGKNIVTEATITALKKAPSITNWLIKQTHGTI